MGDNQPTQPLRLLLPWVRSAETLRSSRPLATLTAHTQEEWQHKRLRCARSQPRAGLLVSSKQLYPCSAFDGPPEWQKRLIVIPRKAFLCPSHDSHSISRLGAFHGIPGKHHTSLTGAVLTGNAGCLINGKLYRPCPARTLFSTESTEHLVLLHLIPSQCGRRHFGRYRIQATLEMPKLHVSLKAVVVLSAR